MGKLVIFRCPRTGFNVQATDDDEPEVTDAKHYKMFECLACGGFHLVEPSTGKLMGDGS